MTNGVERMDENLETNENVRMNLGDIRMGKNLTKEQRNQLFRLLEKYKHVFEWSEFCPTSTTLTEHKINTGNAAPIRQRPYRLPQAAQKEVQRQVDEMLKNQVIEESQSPWASPIILVKKKCEEGQEQKFRFCIDFRKLNEVTVKDSNTLPPIDDTVHALGCSKYFSTLDLLTGYWQVPLAEEDKEKTAFIANQKLYQFVKMPFGLNNAPSTFQRLMDTLLRNMTWKYCLVYLDDVIVYSNDFSSHLKRLEVILARFEAAELKLKPSKCCFGMDEVNYLGYKISSKGLQPDHSKTESIAKMPTPSSKDEIKRFLGMLSYYRRFIPNFSTTAACLFELTKDKVVFQWTREAENAFKILKQQLLQAPILLYPDFDLKFSIYTDASNVGIGAALTQVVDGVIHPIAYASRQLSSTERNYSTSEKEMLAIVWASKHFQSYIYGRHVKFFTDHKPLSTITRAKEPTGRLYTLLLKLQDLDYSIVYCPGKHNNLADLLSRLNEEMEAKANSLEVKVNVDWQTKQDCDRELALIKMAVRSRDENIIQQIKNQKFWETNFNKLVIEDDILKLKNDVGDSVIVVPRNLWLKICSIYHDSISGGHLSFEKTFRSISARFIWPSFNSFIFDFCNTCEICQKFKISTRKKNKHPLVSIKVSKVWDLICVDIIGPLKLTPRNNRFIIIAIDHFSKFVVARAVTSYTGWITIMFLKDDLINKYGVPLGWLTDQGRNFESEIFINFCKEFSIKKLRTTGYHPQCNGLVERTIRTLKQMICAFVNVKHDDWDLVLSDVVFTYNNNIHSSTGYAPNEIIFKKLLPSIQDRALGITPPIVNKDENEMVEEVKQNLGKAQQAQKSQFDKNASTKMVLEVGDFVLLKNSRQRVGQVRSFEPKFNGPFIVKEVVNDWNFKIINPQDNKCQVVHYDRLTKYKMRKIVKNVVNFDQEKLNDDWRENRMRLALFIQRNKPVGGRDRSPIGELIPIIHQADDMLDNTLQLDRMPTVNQNLENSVNEESLLERTVFEDSNQTLAQVDQTFINMDPSHQETSRNIVFNRLNNSQEIEDDAAPVEKTIEYDPSKLAKEVDQEGTIWYICGICGKKCKGLMGLNSHMTKSKIKHEQMVMNQPQANALYL